MGVLVHDGYSCHLGLALAKLASYNYLDKLT